MAALALSALALAGCSGGGSSAGGHTASSAPLPAAASSAAPAAAAKDKITIDNFKFKPSKLTVKAGARITVTNKDTTAHTVTGTGSAKFNTGHIAPGKKKTFTAPKKAGSYPFHCSIHPFMKGTLTVN
ncbi:cupredoxin domain-containing protein [Streptomyces sp. 8L]|uniref:cupredoxin domain-containing protein n=1 Tax=Streptomyces sp. 8L TaxID=2877242 RepID=UPI001CD235B3|nr:cupredoxin domain-containing protein [Streptomyces sp. 8L]MCA1216924.1 cupredoxin domain-containing protein [Streptomyces sp. 8L]